MIEVKNYEKAVEELTEKFVKTYFNTLDYKKDGYWVGGRIGYLFDICDFFITIERMIQCLENKATYDEFQDYYYLESEMKEGEKPPKSFLNWLEIDRCKFTEEHKCSLNKISNKEGS